MLPVYLSLITYRLPHDRKQSGVSTWKLMIIRLIHNAVSNLYAMS